MTFDIEKECQERYFEKRCLLNKCEKLVLCKKACIPKSVEATLLQVSGLVNRWCIYERLLIVDSRKSCPIVLDFADTVDVAHFTISCPLFRRQ
ncbi:hypothetical protein EWB00_007617 [Schistosoma japonicum]|uniref:Uncharacterized protein n=1 Tax=Schistosoma japonicum TaxID=6182 RepID=A0A4Z2CTM9_SCHJA|nr:hypothetical protein EWB00_007617 [Schistosoma japonicum]